MNETKTILTRPLRILLITDVLMLTATAMLTPFYVLFVNKIGGSILDAGAATSIFALVAGMTSLAAGRFTVEVKRRDKLVGVCFMLIGIGFIGYLFVTSVWQLAVVQAFVGLVTAWSSPAYDALYTAHTTGRKLAALQWSAWEAGSYFSIAIGALLGSIIVNYFGFHALFVVMGSLSFFSGLYLFLLPRRIL